MNHVADESVDLLEIAKTGHIVVGNKSTSGFLCSVTVEWLLSGELPSSYCVNNESSVFSIKERTVLF